MITARQIAALRRQQRVCRDLRLPSYRQNDRYQDMPIMALGLLDAAFLNRKLGKARKAEGREYAREAFQILRKSGWLARQLAKLPPHRYEFKF